MRRYFNLFFITFVLLSMVITSLVPLQTVSASPLEAPAFTITMTDTLLNDGAGPISPDEDGDGKADPGETIEYATVITNSGTDATGVTFNDILDLNTTLVAGSINVSPLAGDDSYSTLGNTLLEVGVIPSGIPAVSVTNSAIDSLFDNDMEFLGDNFTLMSVEADTTAPFTTATEQGGSVTVEADGNFSYTPPVDFTGTDNFDYIITDDGAVGSNALTGAGRVTINVTQMVWYVKNDATAGGLGRSTDPFDTLAEAQTASAANETIYIFQGDGTTTGQNVGITLQNGQRLIGEGVALTVPITSGSFNGVLSPTTITLRAAGSQPQIDNTSGNGISVTNISNVEIRGLNIAGSTNAVNVTTNGGNSGGFELANNTIRSAGANGIDVNGGGSGTLTVNLHDNTVTSTGNGIDIQRTAGSLTITAFDDNVVMGNTAGSGINIVGTGATILFDASPGSTFFDTVLGGTTVIGQPGNGVGTSGLVMNNIRGDLSFTDLDVYSDGGVAMYINGTTPNFQTSGTGTRVRANTNTPTLSATGGPALDAQQVNINLTLTSLSSTNSSTTGVSLSTVGGTFFAPWSSTITNATGTDFSINGNSNANANVGVTYGGTITDDLGTLVQIQNVTAASTHSFTGAISDGNDGDGSGISLTNNTGATINFSGGLTLSTGSNAAFTATGGGTVNVCDENPCGMGSAVTNTLTTTTGTALNVANTTIGSNGLTFRSIASNGSTNGIVLNSTGSSGGLTVTANGGICNSAATCTGGAIQNTTGAGISLNTTSSVSMDRMFISNTANDGINGSSVTGFSLTNSTISGAGDGANEYGIFITNLFGTGTINNDSITNSQTNNLKISNNVNTAAGTLTISNSIFTTTDPANGGDCVNIETGVGGSQAGNLTVNISDNNDLNSCQGDGIQVAGNDNSTLHVTVDGSNSNYSGNLGSAVNLAAEGNAQMFALVQDLSNVSTGTTGSNGLNVINIQTIESIDNGPTLNATVQNNSITSLAGGPQNASGIRVIQEGKGKINVNLNNNSINGTALAANGIIAQARAGNGQLNMTVNNNTISLPNAAALDGVSIESGSSAGGDTNTICLNMFSNNSSAAAQQGYRLRVRTGTTFQLQNFVGNGSNSADITTWINTTKSNTGTTDIVLGGAFSNAASCTTPSLPSVAMLPITGQIFAQAQPDSRLMNDSQQVAGNILNNNSIGASPNLGNSKPLFRPISAPVQSGETVNVSIGTLPAGKSVTIRFRVTVNDPLPLGTTKITNQGTVSGSDFSSVLTTNSGTVDCETGSETCTPVDRPDTTVTSINRQTPSGANTNASSVTWRVTFADAVAGLTSSNFTLTDATNSITGESISTVTPVNGSPDTQWDVTVSTGTTGNGTLRLNLANDTGLSHDVTNAPYTSGQTYTIDKTAPLVSSIVRQSPASNPTNADVLVFRVTFNEPVTSVGANSFVATGTTTTINSTTAITPNLVFDLYVDGSLNGDLSNLTGIVGLNVATSPIITDLAGNTLQVVEPTPAATNDQIYTLDNTAPVATNFNRSNPSTSPTNADQLVFQVIFSKDVTGVDANGSDFTVPALTGELINVSSVNASTYNVTISGGDLPNFNGTVNLDFVASPTINDLVGNTLTNTVVSFDQQYTMDNTTPSVTINKAAGQDDPTGNSPINFTVTFSEGVTDFNDASDVTLSGTAGATSVIITGGPTTYNVAVSGMSSNGAVIATVPAGAATDGVNTNAASTSTDNTVTYDATQPTVTINQAAGQSDPTGTSPINFTVVFSEAVTGFVTGDVNLSASTAPGTLTGTVTEIAPMDGTTYNVAVIGMTGDGTVIATVQAGVATDGVNTNAASTSTDNTVLYDTAAPSVTINQAVSQNDPTNTSQINFTVVFSEAVTDFDDLSDISLSGTASATLGSIMGGPTTYTVAVNVSTDGTVIASIPASVAIDAASQPNNASTSNDNTVTYDATSPSVTINQASGQSDPTSTSSINFTAVFSEPVTGLLGLEVNLSGTAGATTAVVTEIAPNNGTTYNVAVSGMTNGGTVIAGIPAGVVQDLAGNNNTASTSTDNTVTFTVNTTTTITADNPDPSTVGQAVTVNFTVTASVGPNPDSGNVTVSDSGGATPCVGAVTAGAGSCNITLTTSGSHTLTATYAGSGLFNGSQDTEAHNVSITIAVNTFTDELNSNGNCSLREAVRAANTNAAVDACPAGSASITDIITLATGTYNLTVGGTDNTAIGGDLDITGNTRITGAGAASTIISGLNLPSPGDRIFHIVSGTVQIESLTIKKGKNAIGAGIYNAGTLTLNSVSVTDNVATTSANGASSGAGIYNTGTLTLNNSTVSNNLATSGYKGASLGGGIHNNGGTLTLNSSTVTGNRTISGIQGTSQGGGIYTQGGSTTLNSTTPSGNTVSTGSGGIAQGPNMYP